jgi:RNA polymerase sigma factor (sigma-70 family)
MPNAPLKKVAQYLNRISSRRLAETLSDRELLDRFVQARDETAFAAMVGRHGSLVRAVCRRILAQPADVDDAFQATFLILLRKPDSISKRESLSSWLHGVALRVSQRARKNRERGRSLTQVPESCLAVDGDRDLQLSELRQWLDRAVQKLPEQFKSSFILCCMQGKSYAQAARLLSCAEGTVSSRVVRARERLRASLNQGGLAVGAGMVALESMRDLEPVSPALVESAIGLVHPEVQSSSSLLTANASQLAQGVLQSMFLAKVTIFAAVVSFVLLGAGIAAPTFLGAHSGDNAQAGALPAWERADDLVGVPSQRDGVLRFIGTEVTKGDKTAEPKQFAMTLENVEHKFRNLKRGEVVEKGQLLALIDDALPRAELVSKLAKLKTAEADKVSSEKTREEAYQRWLTQKKLYSQTRISTSLEDVRGAELTYNRYVYETIGKEAAIKEAEAEVARAKAVLEQYQVRSPCRGIVWRIHKHSGEAVRYLETVVTLKLLPEEQEQERRDK